MSFGFNPEFLLLEIFRSIYKLMEIQIWNLKMDTFLRILFHFKIINIYK